MQQKLFDTTPTIQDVLEPTSGFRDPAFTKNKEFPVHRWVPWIAGFSADFAEDCIDKYLQINKPKDEIWVLDPFAGVGTTLIEVYRRGFNVVGFEIHPYAELAARVRLQATRIPLTEHAEQIAAFEKFMDKNALMG